LNSYGVDFLISPAAHVKVSVPDTFPVPVLVCQFNSEKQQHQTGRIQQQQQQQQEEQQ